MAIVLISASASHAAALLCSALSLVHHSNHSLERSLALPDAGANKQFRIRMNVHARSLALSLSLPLILKSLCRHISCVSLSHFARLQSQLKSHSSASNAEKINRYNRSATSAYVFV